MMATEICNPTASHLGWHNIRFRPTICLAYIKELRKDNHYQGIGKTSLTASFCNCTYWVFRLSRNDNHYQVILSLNVDYILFIQP